MGRIQGVGDRFNKRLCPNAAFYLLRPFLKFCLSKATTFAMAEQVEAAPFGNVKLKVMAYTIPMMLVAR